MMTRRSAAAGFLSALFVAFRPAAAADMKDKVSRTAVITAFTPERNDLLAALKNRRDWVIAGTTYATGEIEGKPVVLYLSGMSMVNAAMTAQIVLDHFSIKRLVSSGISGGLNPDLGIGDVVVPDQWSEYLESVFARETEAGYKLPDFAVPTQSHFGMIFPQPVQIAREPQDPEPRNWFGADPELIAVARSVAGSVKLNDHTADQKYLGRQPKIIIGGKGISGPAFVDNIAFRDYARKTFDANVVDMESAAIAHVAYVNKVPFIAFRSLSDLAGGDAGQNQVETFIGLAAGNSASLVKAFLKALP